jgi:hypothetical protein
MDEAFIGAKHGINGSLRLSRRRYQRLRGAAARPIDADPHPAVLTVQKLHLFNAWWALVLPYAASAQPLLVLIFVSGLTEGAVKL